MHTRRPLTPLAFAALTALAFAGLISPPASAQTPASDYPYQGQPGYALDATINVVDADRDRLTVTGDNGQAYTIDTYGTAIVLRGTTRPGHTADLEPGMRLHIVGTKAAPDLVEADRVTVLPLPSLRPTGPVTRRIPAPANASATVNTPFTPGEHVTLRGTVDAVDQHARTFTLHINDHTRTVSVDDTTDLREVSANDDSPVPLHIGDRVSVVGDYASDGTVQASLVTPRRLDASAPASAPSPPLSDAAPVPSRPVPDTARPFQGTRTLRGRISQESSLFSRDIKVRLNADEEITVHVPKNIPIRDAGRSISVHDLHKDDVVRVTGREDGDAYQADAITVGSDTGTNLTF